MVASARIHATAWVHESARIGDGTLIGAFAYVGENAHIGEGCVIGRYCEVRANCHVGNNVRMGSRCTLSAGTYIGSDCLVKYGFVACDTPDLERDDYKETCIIGAGVRIGANVTLMPGVNVGPCAIIGACSQVRCDVGDHEVWWGNPAEPKFTPRSMDCMDISVEKLTGGRPI